MLSKLLNLWWSNTRQLANLTSMYSRIKNIVYEVLNSTKPESTSGKFFNHFFIWLVTLNILAVVLESVPSLSTYEIYFNYLNVFSVIVFSIEYIARLWAITSSKEFSDPIKGRVRYAFTFLALIDLIVIIPFYLPFIGIDLRHARIVRLIRALRFFKQTRYFKAFKIIKTVLIQNKEALIITLSLMVVIIFLSGSMIYFFEYEHQPKAFSSIPESMWWSICTLTTVGYGDIYPISPMGKVVGSITAIMGIVFFAIPTAIFGAGFINALREQYPPHQKGCPHCGKFLE